MSPFYHFRSLTLAILTIAALHAKPLNEIYKVEDVATPKDVPPEVGGLAFDSQGTLYMLLRRGDVLTTKPVADAKAFQWKLFATGFDNGDGLVGAEPGRLLVAHIP